MKFLVRWLFRSVILLVVLVAVLILLKDKMVKSVVENRVRAQTGLPVKIGKFEMGLLTPTLNVENFVLYNNADFGGSPLLDMPELYVEYDFEDLRAQRIHLKLLRLDIRQLNIVENQQGQTNLFAILGGLKQVIVTGGPARQGPASASFGPIDTFNLTLSTIQFTSLKDPRKNRTVNVGLTNEIVTNVRSEQDLAGVGLKILLRTGLTILTSPPGEPPKFRIGPGTNHK